MDFYTLSGVPIKIVYVFPNDPEDWDADILTPDGKTVYGAVASPNGVEGGIHFAYPASKGRKRFDNRAEAIEWMVENFPAREIES